MLLRAISWAAVCLCLVGTARAQEIRVPPRTVAVIDATAAPTGDPEVAALAARLDDQLDREADLVPVTSDRRAALVGGVPDERGLGLQEARSALRRARDAMARLDYGDAVAEAERGMKRAVDLPPDEEVINLLADLAFVRGDARFLDRDARGAARDFALVHRLDPGRTIDPFKHFPEEVELFEAAAKVEAMSSLDVLAPAGGEVWVDGVAVGAPPATVAVAEGLHAVTVTGANLITRGQLVEVGRGGAKVELEAGAASSTTIVHRLRRRVVAAGGDEELERAVAALVRWVGAQDAVVVGRGADGALTTRIYSGRTAALGEARPARDVEPRGILAPLRPIKMAPPPPRGDGRPEVPPPPEPPWYRRRWVQLGIAGTIVAGVLTTAAIVTTRPVGTSPFEGN